MYKTCAYTAFFWLLDACSLSGSAGTRYHGCLVITTQLTGLMFVYKLEN